MVEKCCCHCCTLRHGTTIVLSICVAQIAYGIFWNIQLLMLLDHNDFPDLLLGLVNVNHIEDFEAVHGLVLAAVGLNAFWLFFVILTARGNSTLSHRLLTPWVLLTYLITFFDVGSTVYFSIKLQGSCGNASELIDDKGNGTKVLTNLILLLLFSRGGFMWFINVYFALVVEKRGKEIDQNHSALAFYIVSHLARRSVANPENSAPCPRQPPSYSCPNFMAPSLLERRLESSGSSWSLSSETFKGFSNPCYGLMRQASHLSTGDLAQVMVDEASSPPAYQQMQFQEEGQDGVFPY